MMRYEDGVIPAAEAAGLYEQSRGRVRLVNLCKAVSTHIKPAAAAGRREIAPWEAIHGGSGSLTDGDKEGVRKAFVEKGYTTKTVHVWPNRCEGSAPAVEYFCW